MRADPHVTVGPLGPERFGEAVALLRSRLPHLTAAEAELPFVSPEVFPVRVLHGATDEHGQLVGVGLVLRPSFAPVERCALRAVVARAHEGVGVGTALRTSLLPVVPEQIRRLGCGVFDDEERSLAVARHWGLEIEEHSIDSSLDLTDPAALVVPNPPPGVSIEEVPDLAFADRDAVAHMLAVSQTNPEAAVGFVMTLEGFAVMLAAEEEPVCVVARVDGVPAAITFGGVQSEILHIAYSGVDPRFRGRGLMRLVKQRAHRVAADLGATVSRTNNEEHNSGIRRINAELGYVVRCGVYRMVQDRPAL